MDRRAFVKTTSLGLVSTLGCGELSKAQAVQKPENAKPELFNGGWLVVKASDRVRRFGLSKVNLDLRVDYSEPNYESVRRPLLSQTTFSVGWLMCKYEDLCWLGQLGGRDPIQTAKLQWFIPGQIGPLEFPFSDIRIVSCGQLEAAPSGSSRVMVPNVVLQGLYDYSGSPEAVRNG